MLLLELLLAIAIFAACALVCAAVYFRAGALSRQSRELNHAVFAAESAAEVFTTATDPAALADLLEGVAQESGCIVYYDDDWQRVSGPADKYLAVAVTEAEGMCLAEIRCYNREGLVYALDCRKLAPKVRS